MKAIAIGQYGSAQVLQVVDLPTPQIRPDQMLVKVYASSVNPIDWKIRSGQLQPFSGYGFPMQLGFDLAGEVVIVGSRVTKFQAGDRVFAYLDSFPGGAYAQYAAVSEQVACQVPANFSYEEAAAVPLAGTTALQALRDLGEIKPGQRVLINGASGGVGTFAVQIAKAMETEVVGVCSSKHLELVQSLGADRVIDYTTTDFTQEPQQYDIVFDAVGKSSFFACRNVLKPNGNYVTTLPTFESLWSVGLTFLFPGQKAKLVFAQANGKDLAQLRDWMEAGKLRPVIERTYPLEDTASAHQESEQGHVTGKLVITVGHEEVALLE